MKENDNNILKFPNILNKERIGTKWRVKEIVAEVFKRMR